ncbi:hypothetical protein TrispH2_012159, partial [Trichoplax sp. H2]
MAATLTLCIGIDRFMLTVYPHSTRKLTLKKTKIITAISWILAAAAALGTVIFNFSYYHLRSAYYFDFYRNLCLGEHYLTPNHIIRLFTVLGYLILAYSTTAVLYTILICKLRKSRLTFRSQLSSIYERRFQLVLILMASTNIITFFVLSISAAISFLNGTPNQVFILQKIIIILPYSNAALDPMIYLIFRFHSIRSQLHCQSSILNCVHPKVEPTAPSETKSSQHENVVITEI